MARRQPNQRVPTLLLCVCCLAGFGALHAAAQQTRCAPKFSFFPKGGEDRNVPHAWGKTAQMAAGNYRDDTLFNVVLTSTNNLPGIVAEAVPVLHVQPVHPLLVLGASNLPPSCTGFMPLQTAPTDLFVSKATAVAGDAAAGPAAAVEHQLPAVTDIAESAHVDGPAVDTASADGAARHLLESSSSSWVDWQAGNSAEGEWYQPAAAGRQLLGAEQVTLPALYRLEYSLNGSVAVNTGDLSVAQNPVHKITLSGLKNYPDDYYCLTLKLTIVSNSGRMAGMISVPPFDLHTITQVCFYKMDGMPSGQVSFSTCNVNLGVMFKDLKPQPIPLAPGSSQTLFHTVFGFNSNLNRTKDWSWPPDSVPKSLTHWMVLGTRSDARKPQLWMPEDKVADGWYNLRMEGSITSNYPSLLALNTMRSGTYDTLLANAPPELAEKPKYLATNLYRNGTVAGIQYGLTDFRQLTGPEEDVRMAVGDEMVLNWEFEGFGDTYCYNDGKLFNNMGTFQCRSPVQIRIPDRGNHTFRVAMQDVCNQTFIVDAVYGHWGYRVLRAPPPRTRPAEEPYTGNNPYATNSNGEKFEVGAPASATLRAPKAAAAQSSGAAAVRQQLGEDHMFWRCAWSVAVMLLALVL